MKLGDRTYKNHLDGYNQLDLLLGKGPPRDMKSFILADLTLGLSALMTSSISFSSNLGAGRAKRSRLTCLPS